MLKYLEIDALLHRLMAAVDEGELSGSVDVQGEQFGPLFPAEDVVGIEVAIFKLHELVEAAEQEDVEKVGRVLSAKNQGIISQARDLLGGLLDSLEKAPEVEDDGTAKSAGPVMKFDPDGERYTLFAPLIKLDAARKTVTGHVLAANVVDLQDDFIRAPEIWKAMESYMLAFQDVGVMHKELNPQLRVVECYQSPLDFVLSGESVKTGDWLMTVKVLDDEIWEKVEKGELRGFSIGGRAKRILRATVPEDVEFLEVA